MDVDLKQIKKLLKIMDDNELSEISVQNGDDSIRLKKKGEPVYQAAAPLAAPAPVAASASAEKTADEPDALPANCTEIVSPMVGTFYRAASPEAAAFVNVGDQIQEGTVLCILEAMKLMNEFKSEVSGKIVKVLVENGQPVEYGQAIFVVEK